MKKHGRSLADRFFNKVCKTRACWLFTPASKNRKQRYGQMWAGVGIGYKKAHHVSWFVCHGEWPTQNVLHACDVGICVRPSHLFLGTQGDNIRDCYKKGRRSSKGTDHPSVKLTEAAVIFIRKHYALCGRGHASKTSKWLCSKFNVSRTTLVAIAQRRLWGHIK